MYITFKASERGESHKESGLPCQDAVLCKSYKNGGIAITADGHGGKKYFRSDEGSRLACNIAFNAMLEFLKIRDSEIKNKRGLNDAQLISLTNEQLTQLERAIITRWRKGVLSHFNTYELTKSEEEFCKNKDIDLRDENERVRTYGTTLIAALMRRDFWFVLQIGDGKCVVLDDTGIPYFPPELEDESLAGGLTTSLCDSDAAGHFRHDFGFERIKGITVATDGVSDSFMPDDYLKLHSRLYSDFIKNDKKAEAGLRDSISLWSQKGSRDDVSISGVFYKKWV